VGGAGVQVTESLLIGICEKVKGIPEAKGGLGTKGVLVLHAES